jgi:hypothetical protein
VAYWGTLTAELRDANPHTHDAMRRLVEHVGGEVVSVSGTKLVARPAPTRSGGEQLMRHLQVDPLVIPESVSWR